MSYAAIETSANQHGLTIYGGFQGSENDGLPPDHKTLLMLGPASDFWPHFKTQPEFETTPDPIDSWSTRVITKLAKDFDAKPFLPFGGPPYAPFLSWATKTGRAWSSPVGMLVHDTTGLMVSYRGALAFRNHLDLPETGGIPCDACVDKPCLTACPVNALSATDGYKTKACHGFLETPDGKPCLTQGCIARRACPVSHGANRTIDQSAHHMAYFHPKGRFE